MPIHELKAASATAEQASAAGDRGDTAIAPAASPTRLVRMIGAAGCPGASHRSASSHSWRRAILAAVITYSLPLSAAAGPPMSDSAATDVVITPEQARLSLQALASQAARSLPRVHEGDEDWGETKKIWAGVKMRLDGLKLQTHRRYREVRHGRWTRYQLTLPDSDAAHAPGRKAFQIAIDDVQQLADGRWQIQSTITAPIDFHARVERWNLGVQWYSISADGEFRIRFRSTLTIGFHADYTQIPPALVIDPRVDRAHLELERFEVDRISKIGGDVAEELGDFLEHTVGDKWVKKENRRLVDRLNRAIDKRREQLCWSLSDWLQPRRSSSE